jgi:hypothetical protein
MHRPSGSQAAVVLLWLALAAAVFAAAAPRVDRPGLYYDEAFMGQQARDFFQPERAARHAASVREVRLFGRPFPLRNAVYLGSLKSQLLIPSFALFGATPRVLRLTSLAFGLVGLLFAMLWARRLLGAPAACVAGLLLASDPSWTFFSLYEWGPFTTGLVCRTAGFWCLTRGWSERRSGALVAGGLLLGLGIYNRADFAVILVASAGALVVAAPGVLREALADRSRRPALVGAGVALVAGAAPMLLSLADLLTTSASHAIQQRGGVGEKLRVLWSVLEGSRFYRVIDAGGLFDRMFDAPAPRSGLGLAAIAAAPVAFVSWLRRGRARDDLDRVSLFLLVAAFATGLGMLAVPGAVRAHHLLNLMPFPHLLVAAAGAQLWRGVGSRSALVRGGLALALAAILAGNVLVVARTFDLIERTGGRGRWSDALTAVAREVEAEGTTRVVSLDWGFHEPLLFLTRRAELLQPIWRIPVAVRTRGEWRYEGGPRDLYLVHPAEYDLFGNGPPFLRAAERLAEREPDAVEIRRYTDREGGLAFLSVRFARPHLLVRRRSGFRIHWR